MVGKQILLNFIEEVRSDLVSLANTKALREPEVISMSQRLDALLDAYNRLFI